MWNWGTTDRHGSCNSFATTVRTDLPTADEKSAALAAFAETDVRRPATWSARRAFAPLVVAFTFLALVCAQTARAWVIPASAPSRPECPAIPDANDVKLSAEDLERVRAGEIIVRVGQMGPQGRRVWAIGYLHANPVWLFDVGTDSRLAPELSEVIQRVDVREQREHGKVVHGVATGGTFLPKFDYTLAVSYLADRTGQCWAQTEGDFETNEGSHSYLWDPERGETLAVFTFELTLKGMLRLIPDDLVRHMTARTLPDFMHNLETFSSRLEREDPDRAVRNERQWDELRRRLEANELPGRVWRGPPHDTVEIAKPIRIEAVAAE